MEIVIAIAAKIAEYTVGPVGQWLCYSCHFNINIENLKNQEKNLRDAKNRVQHLIDAASRNGEEIEDDVKTWLIRADHITELATTKLHEIEEEAGTGSSNAACLNLKHRHQLSREAKKIAENIAELVKNGNFDRVSYRPASEGMEMTRNMDYNYMAMVSRMTMVKEIMEALGNADIDKIGVWGMPGVGKSTLMKEIARQAKEEKLFNEVVMTMVTNSPDVRRIQGAIAYKLDLNFDQEADEKDRASHLQRRLSKDKKVLVILDDIWKAFDLQEMGIPSKGCKVVMISRDRDVLISGMDTQKAIHELKILQKDEAWNLFEKMAGDSFQDRPEVRGIATKIAEKCAGLPIALVIVSKALKNKSLGIWKDALVQLTRPAPENDSKIWSPIYSCIHLSYEHLVGEEVKSLFLLCAQQDYYIFYQDLLRYGFGLGLFLNIYTLEEARNRLESLLSNLQDSCLLLESPHSSKEFNMHDLVRDVAKIIASKNHNMFVMRDDGGQKAWPDVDALNRCEALSIHGGDIHKHPNKMECPKLRFFHVDCKDTLNLKIPNIFFQGMEKLEVLSLRNMQLSSLFPLTNLQTLCLDGCMLGDIHGIGELKNLVILSLARSDISNLLREIGSLTRLRLLDLSNCSKLRVIPPNVLSSLVNLEELYMRKTYVQWEVEGPSNEGKNASLAELKKLSHLITLEIHIRNGMKLPKDLFSKKLERYKIRIGDIMPWETFNGATFSRTLKLKLNGSFQLDSGIKMLLKRTEYLYLDESNRTESVLYELNREDFQQLKHLHIQNSGNIKHIPKLRTPAIAFPILETFVLKHMISLEEICQGNLPFTSFKSLKVLNVENCKKLRFIFSSSIARGLSLLEELNITRCNNVGAIFMKEEEDGIEDQEDMMLFGRLQTLVLKDLPKLVGFLSTKDSFMTDCRETNSEGNHDLQLPLLHHHQLSFPNLKILHLRGLSKIKHVWSNVNGCESLKSLEIHDCGAMEEIVAREDGTDPTTRLLFPSLNYLRLDGLPKLKWFFQGVCTLESSSSKELHGQGGTLFGPEEIAFPNLTNLNLRNLPKIKHVWNKDPQTILRFQNLQHITASRCKRLKSLFPASVGSCLKQLKTITIDDFCGMEEIVKVEGGEAARRTLVFVFPQVTYLSLSYLPRLECFYKGVHISKWPMLKKIKIEKCNKVEVFASGLVSEETVEKRQSQMSIKQPIFLVDEMSFPSLEILNISIMKKLEIIWYGLVAASPTRLDISNCDSLEAVYEEHEGQDGKESHALTTTQLLRAMSLYSLPKMRNIWNIKDCHQRHMYSFPNLLDIDVKGCESLKSLFPAASVAASLPQLQSLKIHDCGVMEEIVAREDGADPSTRLLFPSLTLLRLDGLPKLEWFFQGVRTLESSSSSKELHEQGGTLFGIEEVAFPNLTKLRLRCLPKIKHVWSKDPQTILRFQNLQKITVQKCASLKSLFPTLVDGCLKQLKKISIHNCGVEEIVGAEGGVVGRTLVFVFPQVTSFYLENLSRLECFYKGVHILKWPMLKKMKIEKCDRVEVFASGLVNFEESVEEKQSHMSIKQSIFLVNEMSFPSLEILKIRRMEKLEIIWNMKDSHQRHMYSFPNLLDIDVKGCESLKSLFPAASVAASLPQLQSLKIHDCGVMEEIVAREDGTDPTTRLLFPSLNFLSLDELPKLKWFFQGLHTLELSLSKELHEQGGTLFGIEEVAFPNLTELHLCCLAKIKHVWSKDPQTIQRFQNLQKIIAWKCASLKSLLPASVDGCLKQLKKIIVYDCGVEEIVGAEGGEVVGRTLVFVFPQVAYLYLANLPRLESFYNGVHISKWPMLKKMSIEGCKKVEVFASGLVREETVEKRQSQMSIKQPIFLVDEMSFPSLEILKIRRMEELEMIWNMKDCYQRHMYSFPNLLEINVKGCESLKSLFPAASVAASLPQLQSLKIHDCGVMEEIVVREDGTDPTTRLLFPSLNFLSLDELPKLKWFFQGLRTLESSLSKELHEQGGTLFGIEEMSFPSLEI
ncbi:uncharacterized protein LOC122318860 isoform X2 [Carya illinoinensis]|uniref:AAA+ ATPase domain-containing protein n=1 Tax=Carya illinoinensis TaxID=32201 RepID=A0A8T1PX64_CARIL|nr:uncharacterized protein LOC122318860 isoform X2 [Carya illinoinensis]KAG6646173.1 hypothetical protein CIPAW_08G175500 [Carya illinoinensis]KAG6646180.1 hypothetical protein CIPAW_08G175500 [Carya illinoinensis]